MSESRLPCSRLLCWLIPLLILPALAARDSTPKLVYDSDYGGYVPLVEGIERPDLVVSPKEGKVPASLRRAARRARASLRRNTPRSPFPDIPKLLGPSGRGSATTRLPRSFRRRRAVITELTVLDAEEQPIEGARVFRYYDPAFHTVNEDPSGSRLFGIRRFLPHPFPASTALEAVVAEDALWRLSGYATLQPRGPRLTQWINPFGSDLQSEPRLPVEFVGRSGRSGQLLSVSGIFDLRDSRRFPGSLVPGGVRIGFIVIAEGYRPGLSELRYTRGGIEERRTVHLLEAPFHALLASPRRRIAEQLADGLDLSGTDVETIESQLDETLSMLEADSASLPEQQRKPALGRVRTILIDRLLRRAPRDLRLPLARMAVRSSPSDPVQLYLLAQELHLAESSSPAWMEQAPAPLTPSRKEAESLLREVLHRAPTLLPAYRLLDQLLLERGAGPAARRRLFERLLERFPFDRWARARMAALLLEAHRPVEAFDHLRYTWMMEPALRGDRELAMALARYYWNLGLPEKAGTFLWLHTGRAPEDPFRRLSPGTPAAAPGQASP